VFTNNEKGQVARQRRGKLRRQKEKQIENPEEICLEQLTCTWRGCLRRKKKEKKMLRHLAYHYLTWNKICNARTKRLKAKLRRVLRNKKEQDKLKILDEASLAQQST